ncbi:hypothetical protein GFPCMMHI_01132 [Ensifer adhaerens]|nr:hypothetical protein [Ensifer adhaerens]
MISSSTEPNVAFTKSRIVSPKAGGRDIGVDALNFKRLGGADQIQFNLSSALTSPEKANFNVSATYYQEALFRTMDANGMPRSWFSDGFISLAVVGPTNALCNIEIVSDLNKAYRFERTIDVRPHDPSREQRRKGKFGPSNQKGL